MRQDTDDTGAYISAYEQEQDDKFEQRRREVDGELTMVLSTLDRVEDDWVRYRKVVR